MKQASIYALTALMLSVSSVQANLAVTVTKITDGNITFQWQDDEDRTDEYALCHDGGCSGIGTDIGTYTKTGLDANRSYSFHIEDDYGASNPDVSDMMNITTTHRWRGALLSCVNIALGHTDDNTTYIPDKAELESLTAFSCTGEHINDDMYCVLDLIHLESLDLSWSQVSGTIPEAIDTLSELQNLNLSYNAFDAQPIPAGITRLTNLAQLQLSHVGYYGNRGGFTGTIPREIGNLTKLTVLSLPNGSLEGTIPSSIYALGDLQYLELQNNQLSGKIPENIGNFTKLKMLVLSNNRFSGAIPASISDLEDTLISQGLRLETNCNLFGNTQAVIDTVDAYGYNDGSSGAYQYVLDTNTHDCFGSLVPVNFFLLQ